MSSETPQSTAVPVPARREGPGRAGRGVLACGVVYLGGARTWFSAIGSPGWSDWAFGLNQVLEAALLAALLTSAFRVVWRRGRTPNLNLSGTTPDGRDRLPRPR